MGILGYIVGPESVRATRLTVEGKQWPFVVSWGNVRGYHDLFTMIVELSCETKETVQVEIQCIMKA